MRRAVVLALVGGLAVVAAGLAAAAVGHGIPLRVLAASTQQGSSTPCGSAPDPDDRTRDVDDDSDADCESTVEALSAEKITICHATGNGGYVQISPSVEGVLNGHADHPSDIIPPFEYEEKGETKTFPGLNWDAAGQAIYDNGCSQPPPPEPCPSKASVTSTDSTGQGSRDQYAYPEQVYARVLNFPAPVPPATSVTYSYTVTYNDAGTTMASGTGTVGSGDFTFLAWDGGNAVEGDKGYTISVTAGACSRQDQFQYRRDAPTPQPRLKVRKTVVGAPGRPATDFSFSVNGGPATAFEADGENELKLAPGTYTVTEAPVDGFTTTTDGCTGLVLSSPQTTIPVCTITNTAKPATPVKIRVKKVVIDSTRPPSDFSFVVNGGASTQFDADGVNDVTLPPGTYDVTEPPVEGFTTTSEGCTGMSPAAPPAPIPTCTITNTAEVEPPVPVRPVGTYVKCVDNFADGSFQATFGYTSANDIEITIPIGELNQVTPPDPATGVDRGQPATFQPGSVAAAFTVTGAVGTTLSWSVTSPPETPGFPPIVSTASATAGFEQKCSDPPEPPKPVVKVFVTCVDDTGDTYSATYGYENPGTGAVSLPIPDQNRFSPAPADRKQPIEFLPGKVDRAVVVMGIPSSVVLSWTVETGNGGPSTARASADFATKCSTEPQPPEPGPEPIPPQPEPLPPDPTREPIGIFAQCITVKGATFDAVFGYQNDNEDAVTIPVGSANRFIPGGDRGQTTTFLPGNHQNAFTVANIPGRQLVAWAVTYAGATRLATPNQALPACSSGPAPVQPIGIFACVVPHGDTFDAVFGYENDNPVDVTVPIGLANHVLPQPANRGQPTVFNPGRHERAFTVRGVSSPVLVWTVAFQGVRSLVVTAAYPDRCDVFEPPQPLKVFPFCVRRAGGTYTAVFGYANLTHVDVVAPIGAANHVSPLPVDRGQPPVLRQGIAWFAFSVRKVPVGRSVVWTVRTGQRVLRATATATGRACVTTPVDPDAQLEVDKSVNPDSVSVGGRVEFRIAVRNKGTTDAQSVTVVDRGLDDKVQILSATASQGRCRVVTGGRPGWRVVCTLGRLGAGDAATIVIAGRARAAGLARDRVLVQSVPFDRGPDNTDRVTLSVKAAHARGPRPHFTG